VEKLITIKGKRIIINVQHSQIGYGYPRMFIEVKPGQCINFDIALRATFVMKQEDFDDWAKDAVTIPEADVEKTLKEIGIDYTIFVTAIEDLGKATK
jgi:hypothetical protein